jgi:hypothetical protein
MSDTGNGKSSGNWLSLIIALIGAISTIGGAWITTYGGSAAQTSNAQVAPVVQVSAAPNPVVSSPTLSTPIPSVINAPAAPAPSTANAPAADYDPSVPARNGRMITHNRAWANDSNMSGLILETLEVADDVVRVNFLFENSTGNTVRFYTAPNVNTSDHGILTYISTKKNTKFGAINQGGELFADPRVVEIPAGVKKRGWLEYALRMGKESSLSIYFEGYTEGTSGGTVTKYHPLKFDLKKADDD